MKTNIRNAITATVFLLTPIVYGAGNESLYMESVGRINPSMAQVLTGEVQVSGIQSPTKLTLDLLLSNGSLYTVNDISVNQDGIYNIFELIDTTLLPQGIAILNVSSDKNLSEKNLLVDVSLQDFEEETPQTSTGASGVSVGSALATGAAVGTTFGGPVGTVAGAIVGGLASGSFIFAEYLYDNE